MPDKKRLPSPGTFPAAAGQRMAEMGGYMGRQGKLAAYTAVVQKPGRLKEVFRRLLTVGVRLNAQRDPRRLPEQILKEVSVR